MTDILPIINDYGRANDVAQTSGSSGGGGSGGTPTDVSSGIDQSADIEAIKSKIDAVTSAIAALNIDVDTLNLNTDTLEINTDQVETKIDNVEGAVLTLFDSLGFPTDAIADSTQQGTIEARLRYLSDRIEKTYASIGAITSPVQTNAASDSPIVSYLRGLVSLLNTTNTNITAVLDRLPSNLGVQSIAGSLSVVPAASSNFAPSALTDTQLRASAVVVSVNNLPTTQSISAVALPLPTGAATETTLQNIRFSLPSELGSQPSASSLSVVPAAGSNFSPNALTDAQLRATAVPVTVANVATATNQSVANTSLSSIDSKTPVLVSGRQPVDGSGVVQPVSAASLPLPSGASTAAKQDTANTTLANLEAALATLNSALVILTTATSNWNVIASTNPVNATTLPVNARLRSFYMQNNTGTAVFVQIFASTPTLGSTPTQSYRLPSNGAVLLGTDFYGSGGSNLTVANPFVGISSTNATFTAASGCNVNLRINYTI